MGEKLIVTPEQYRDGYVVHANPMDVTEGARRYPYKLIHRLEDGNYLVRDPRLSDQR